MSGIRQCGRPGDAATSSPASMASRTPDLATHFAITVAFAHRPQWVTVTTKRSTQPRVRKARRTLCQVDLFLLQRRRRGNSNHRAVRRALQEAYRGGLQIGRVVPGSWLDAVLGWEDHRAARKRTASRGRCSLVCSRLAESIQATEARRRDGATLSTWSSMRLLMRSIQPKHGRKHQPMASQGLAIG